MVQRIKFLPKIAVSNILEGDIARRCTAGIFYACTQNISGAAPVWNCNGTTAFEVLDNGSAAPSFFAAKRTNISEMSNAERTCLEGKHSTQQATGAHETGIQSIVEITYRMVLHIEVPETRKRLNDMFFDWLAFVEDLDSDRVRKMVWAYHDLNYTLDSIANLAEHSRYMHRIRFPELYRHEKAATEFP